MRELVLYSLSQRVVSVQPFSIFDLYNRSAAATLVTFKNNLFKKCIVNTYFIQVLHDKLLVAYNKITPQRKTKREITKSMIIFSLCHLPFIELWELGPHHLVFTIAFINVAGHVHRRHCCHLRHRCMDPSRFYSCCGTIFSWTHTQRVKDPPTHKSNLHAHTCTRAVASEMAPSHLKSTSARVSNTHEGQRWGKFMTSSPGTGFIAARPAEEF